MCWPILKVFPSPTEQETLCFNMHDAPDGSLTTLLYTPSNFLPLLHHPHYELLSWLPTSEKNQAETHVDLEQHNQASPAIYSYRPHLICGRSRASPSPVHSSYPLSYSSTSLHEYSAVFPSTLSYLLAHELAVIPPKFNPFDLHFPC